MECEQWMHASGKKMFPFQRETFNLHFDGYSGLLNAPTGMGKTFALAFPILMDFKRKQGQSSKPAKGLQALWITPLRALAGDIQQAISQAAEHLVPEFQVGLRNGDTPSSVRQKQTKSPPHLLITTPESVHVMLSSKNGAKLFRSLETVVVDEWHDLLSTKRGVQVELALSYLKKTASNPLQVWGISATIGNMDESVECLWGHAPQKDELFKVVKCKRKKKLRIQTILPDSIEEFPWSGHMGTKLLKKVPPLIKKHQSTLIFTNTRNQCEVWYQKLLNEDPSLAGRIAMHHGSLSRELRTWVESALHSGELKAVVSTSSLDLGVDFRPVDAVIQIGSPKGVSRFVQRAGRSGHSPFETSLVYFLPTNSLELIEASGLKRAVKQERFEKRIPVIRAFDVLAQFLITLAVGPGFRPREWFHAIRDTFCFSSMDEAEWLWLLNFITDGGDSLQAYEEFNKVEVDDTGLYQVKNRRTAMRHRLSIGTIVGETSIAIRYPNQGLIGHVEEFFISRLTEGSHFVFGGTVFQLLRVEGLNAFVQKSKRKSGAVPSWQGGRMSLSSEISEIIRQELTDSQNMLNTGVEFKKLNPLLQLQQEVSAVPTEDIILIESMSSHEGYHLYVYPFEGRMVNEGMALLFAYRLSEDGGQSFSVGMNDYGFELLSNKPIELNSTNWRQVISTQELYHDLTHSVNHAELARKQFRGIAAISGLTFKGFPNKVVKEKHLHANSSLFFDVFSDYDPDNLLLRQAYEEAVYLHMDEVRMRRALNRLAQAEARFIQLDKPSPFSFPILVDRLRETLSTEPMEERVRQLMSDFNLGDTT
jgi:ATP-dependent Lhr-like helicase